MRGAEVRAGRNRRRRGLTVAVLGATGELGSRVAARLAEDPGVRSVLAIDAQRGTLDGVTWRIVDIADPALVRRLNGVDVVVHPGPDLNVTDRPGQRAERNLRVAQTVLTASAAAGVRRVVVVSSAMVHGALPDNPVPLEEDGALRAAPDGGVISELLELEDLYQRSRTSHPGTAVTVVRPAMLVGPGVDTVLTRHFEAPRLLVVRGTAPTWQFCHVDDLASALHTVVVQELDGPITVASEGWLTQEEVERVTTRSRIELPESFVLGTAARLHRLGLSPAPAGELDYLSHSWVVSAARLRATGWRPEHDNTTALQALMEQIGGRHALAARRIGRKETAATLGAAGATVAVLGTAVAVRRARRRGR